MKLKRLLHVAMRYDYGEPHRGLSGVEGWRAGLRQIYPGLETAGFDFLREQQRWGKAAANEQLVATVKRFRPDLVYCWFFHSEADPSPQAIDECGRYAVTANLMFDDDWRYEDYSRLWARHFHFMLTNCPDAIPKYQHDGYGSKVILWQYSAEPSPREELERIPQDRQVTFVGQSHSNRVENISYLREAGIPVETFGRGWSENSVLPPSELRKMFRRSRISLNFTRSSTGNVRQIKSRVFEIAASLGFQICEAAPHIEAYYEPDREIVLFRSLTELEEKVRFYLSHEPERLRIQEAAYRRTAAEHTMKRRYDAMFAAMGFS